MSVLITSWFGFLSRDKGLADKVRLCNVVRAAGVSLMVGLLSLWNGTGMALSSESPDTPREVTNVARSSDDFDYVERDVMIPMRDGVKLHTVIIVPKGAMRAPMLLTRTPYGARQRVSKNVSVHLSKVLDIDVVVDAVASGKFIRVVQDIRGKHGSEGGFVMTRPLVGPLNSSNVDESTDCYDTIDWLVHHVPESNGKVGILGFSCDGFTSLMALIHPHPALHAVVPMNAMVDGWVGDDYFHNGAFRLDSFTGIYNLESTRNSTLT